MPTLFPEVVKELPEARPLLSRRDALLSSCAACLTLGSGVTHAQEVKLPQVVSLVVGFPPGGPNDLIARMLAPILAERLRVSVVVENRAGADGELSAAAVARGPANGRMLLFASAGAITISPAIKKDLPYAPVRDFAPIAQVASSPLVLVTNANSRYHSPEDVVDAARRKPGALTYASAGTGSPTHLAGALLCELAKVDILHVPYRGGGPALTDLMGGQVDFYFAGVATALPFIRDGKLRALGMTGGATLPILPDVAPLAQALRLPGYEIDNWYGVLAPAKTEAPLIRHMADAIEVVLKDPTLRQKMEAQGIEPALKREQQFAELIQRDLAKWQQLANVIRIT